jgi:hypothetical protein
MRMRRALMTRAKMHFRRNNRYRRLRSGVLVEEPSSEMEELWRAREPMRLRHGSLYQMAGFVRCDRF